MESGVQSKCFICSQIFDAKALAEHERQCLTQLQEGLTSITKEVDGLLDFEGDSVLSATSSGSNESSRKNVRCYICGEDFASHFISVHERQCKRRWDSGVTSTDGIKKGVSLGHIPAARETEKGKRKEANEANNIRKAQSVANIAHHGPKQAWNARMRDKGSKENLSKEKGHKRVNLPKRKERPKSAYVTSTSSQNLDKDLFASKEFGIYDDSHDIEKTVGSLISDKSVSMQDLTSNVVNKDNHRATTPKFIECQYCFKMFSIHSIHIHEKKCLCRGDNATPVKNGPKKSTRQNGRCISVNELHSAKDDDDWFLDKQFDSSLAVSVDNLNSPTTTSNAESPRFLLCSYCSKPFGSKSLPIHLPQCQKKFEREQARKESLRLPIKNSQRGTNITRVNGFPKKPLRYTQSSPTYETSIPFEKTPINDSTRKSSTRSISSARSSVLTSSPNTDGKPPSSGRRTPRSGHKSSPSASAYVACQFCNNYYGSASVKIHEAKCETKMLKRKEEKPLTKPIGRNLGRLFGLDR